MRFIPFRMMVSFLVGTLALWILAPLTTLRLAERGLDPVRIGVFGSMPWAAVMALAPVAPRVIAGLGPLRAYRLGLALSMAAVTAFLLTDQISVWFAANLVRGIGLSIMWVVADSWVASSAPQGRRGLVLGLYETFNGLVISGGPAVLAVIGVDGPNGFWAALAALGISLVLLVGARPPDGLLTREPAPARWRDLVRVNPAILIPALMCGLIEGAAIGMFPLYGLALGFTPERAALLVTALGLGNVITQLPLGMLSDRLGRRSLFYAGGLVLLAGPLVWTLAANDLVLWIVVFIWGGAVGSMYTLATLQAGHDHSGDLLVRAIAGVAAMYTLGSMIGPTLGGAMLSVWSPHGLTAVILALVLAGLGLRLAVERTVRGLEPSKPEGLRRLRHGLTDSTDRNA
jgi:MFS family permease